MLAAFKRLLGIQPNIYALPYNERAFIITVSTAMERVR
jgi:hypothetical protein